MARSRSRSPAYSDTEKGRGRSHSRSSAGSRSRSPVDERRGDRYERRGDRYSDRRDDREERKYRRDDRGDSASVLIRHLNYKTPVDELRKIFSEFGEVVDIYLPLDYQTRRPRGFGFVQFANASDADASRKALDQTEIDGSKVEVVIAQQNRKSPGTMRRITRRDDDRYDDRRGGRSYRGDGYSRRDERYSRRSHSRSRSGGRRYRDERRH
jgi:RNA recognition motif-containing protein